MEAVLENLPIIGFVVAILFSLLGLFFLFDLRKKFHRLFQGKPAEHHEALIAEVLKRTNDLEQVLREVIRRLEATERTGERSFQKVGFMRYNPFEDTGGDQSFSLALLDQSNNGFVISSLYGREGTRVYGKAIDHGSAKHPLSEEETEVLKRAKEKEF